MAAVADAEHLAVVRRLLDEHAVKFGEARAWTTAGSSRELRNWVAVGCPPTGEIPSDKELAAAAEVHHGEDRQPTRRGRGWETSEPIADEVDSDAVSPEETLQAEEIAAARAQASLEKQAGDVSAPLPEGLTRQQLRHRRTGEPGRPA